MPFKPNEREYRMAAPFTASETGFVVEGYATTFDVPYDFGRDGMREMIASTAFGDADMSDVIFQFDHEGMVLARMRNGTLQVDLDPHGMHVTADLGGCEEGRRLYEAIKNGLVDRMSWAFTIADGGWEYDEATRTATITRVDKVYDVSAVSVPANEDTAIAARSYLDGVIESEMRRESARCERESAERARLAARFDFETGAFNGVR